MRVPNMEVQKREVQLVNTFCDLFFSDLFISILNRHPIAVYVPVAKNHVGSSLKANAIQNRNQKTVFGLSKRVLKPVISCRLTLFVKSVCKTKYKTHSIYYLIVQRIFLNLTVSANELYNRIGRSKIQPLIVDTRTYGEYKKGHIPGSVNIDLFQLHWFDTSKRGIRDFNRQMRIVLSNIGIKSKSQVIFYDDISGVSAARGVWLLLYFSHKMVSMLDGGFEMWKRQGYPIEIKSNPLIHSEFKGKIDKNVLSTAEEVKKSIKQKKVVILDARSNEEFDGSDVRAARRGHIPSAVNIDWQKNIENSSFRNKEKLLKIYSQIPKNYIVVTYCQGGYRAANSFLALKLLGYEKVKMYLGSWGEWGNDLDLPVSN